MYAQHATEWTRPPAGHALRLPQADLPLPPGRTGQERPVQQRAARAPLQAVRRAPAAP